MLVDGADQLAQTSTLSSLVLHHSADHYVRVCGDTGDYWVNLVLLLAAIDARSTCHDLMLL